MPSFSAGYLLAGLVLVAASVGVYQLPAFNPVSDPSALHLQLASNELFLARQDITFRGVNPLPYAAPNRDSLFRDCFPAQDNQPIAGLGGLATNIDPRRIPWPPVLSEEKTPADTLDPGVFSRYETRRNCDSIRPTP